MQATHEKADREIARLRRELSAFYVAAEKKANKKVMAYYATIKAKLDELTENIETAETEEEKKKAKQKYLAFIVGMVASKEFKEMCQKVAKEMYLANQKAAAVINSRTPAVYAENYNVTGRGISRDANGYRFKPVTEEEADKYSGIERQEINKEKDTKWNRANVTRAVIAGALLGLGAKKIFDNVARRTTQKNRESSNRQASDMVTGAESMGRMDSMYRASDEGLNVEKEWICTFDNRTRDSHIEYDSMGWVDLDYEYNTGLKKPKDPNCSIMEEVCNCRCSIGYRVNGREGSATRSAREGDVVGSYKRPSSFEDTESVTIESMSYEEWIKWRGSR